MDTVLVTGKIPSTCSFTRSLIDLLCSICCLKNTCKVELKCNSHPVPNIVNTQEMQEIKQMIQNLRAFVKQPRPLQNLCSLVIRQEMQSRSPEDYINLPIPPRLRDRVSGQFYIPHLVDALHAHIPVCQSGGESDDSSEDEDHSPYYSEDSDAYLHDGYDSDYYLYGHGSDGGYGYYDPDDDYDGYDGYDEYDMF